MRERLHTLLRQHPLGHGDTSRAHQAVDCAEGPAGQINRVLHLGVAGDVGLDEMRARAVPGRPGGTRLIVDVDDHGAAAGRDDHVHGRAAKAGRASGDDDGSALEMHPVILSA